MSNKLKLLTLDESPPPKPESPLTAPPPWTELPSDVTANILQRLNDVEILQNAQRVCTTWWKVCHDPAMWRAIKIVFPEPDLPYVGATMCRRAVDRSQGQLIDLHVTLNCDDELLDYIANRSTHLRRLTLNSCWGASIALAVEAVKKLPELEECRLLSYFRLVPADIESIAASCPSLNSFAIDLYRAPLFHSHNEYAVAISKFMPHLQHLRLDDCQMDNNGLEAILDGCPHLESLHLRCCGGVDLGGALGQRCRNQIKDFLITLTYDYDIDNCNDDYSYDAYADTSDDGDIW